MTRTETMDIPVNGTGSAYPFKPRGDGKGNEEAVRVAQELRELLSCEVLCREDRGYVQSATLFNGAIKSVAMAIVKPTNTTQVSKAVRYCRDHHYSLSVKAGGTGVHGQSVAGDIVIDLASMNEISIALPDSSATTLHESFAQLQLSEEPLPISSAKRTVKEALMDEDSDEQTKKTSRAMSTGLSSNHSSNPSRSNSASGSRGSRSSDSNTPPTSYNSSHHFKGESSSSSSSSFPRMPTTTYVNPSPTQTISIPFTSPSFTSLPTYTHSSTYELNTNPNPPPYTIVSFGAGCHSKQLDNYTSKSQYGAFYCPTSAFPVGSGQFLLGGFGFIGRRYGLAMDNLVEAEMVLADGRIVWVGEGGTSKGDWMESEDPEEIWWGLRGAGPSLGIITRLRAKAYYVPSVFAGNFIYVFDKLTAPSLMRHIRDCIKGASVLFYCNIILSAGPPGAPAIIIVQLCYSGPRVEGEKFVEAIGSWDGGRPLFQDFSERSFERQQIAVEEVLKGGVGKKWFIRSSMLGSMTDHVIDETCNRFRQIPDGCTWLFEYTQGGVQGNVTDSCYPQSHRRGAFTVAALHQWAHDEPPALDTKCVTTAEEWIDEVIRPNGIGGPLPCFLQSAQEEAVRSVYGENYDRLYALKCKLDPTGFFKHSLFPCPDSRGIADQWSQFAPLTKDKLQKEQAEKRRSLEIRKGIDSIVSATGSKGKGKAFDFTSDGGRLTGSNGVNGVSGMNGMDGIESGGGILKGGAANATVDDTTGTGKTEEEGENQNIVIVDPVESYNTH